MIISFLHLLICDINIKTALAVNEHAERYDNALNSKIKAANSNARIMHRARLLVKSHKLEINGSVVNDGYAFFGAKSSLLLNDSGMLYTSAKGRIIVRTDKVGISESSSTVCLGKGSFSTAEAALNPSIVGAVMISVGVGGLGDIYNPEILTTEEALATTAWW